jgi:transcription elongation factor GreA
MAGTPLRDHAKRALTEELDVLRSRRRKLAESLATDDPPGDRADQADVIERASELEWIERRIADITHLLASRISSPSEVPTDQVGLGSIVTLRYADGTTEVLRIGTVVEDDDGTVVTPDSPLGRALLGQSPGQDITWPTPSTHHQAQILTISHPPT